VTCVRVVVEVDGGQTWTILINMKFSGGHTEHLHQRFYSPRNCLYFYCCDMIIYAKDSTVISFVTIIYLLTARC
jgi:hypothetical protein